MMTSSTKNQIFLKNFWELAYRISGFHDFRFRSYIEGIFAPLRVNRVKISKKNEFKTSFQAGVEFRNTFLTIMFWWTAKKLQTIDAVGFAERSDTTFEIAREINGISDKMGKVSPSISY